MTRKELLEQYSQAPPDRQASILAWLVHSLTLINRTAHFPSGQTSKMILALNELQQIMTSQIKRLADGDPDRHPDGDFLDLVFEWAGQAQVADDFGTLLADAIRKENSQSE